MDISVLGIDLGKNVCSVVGLDASGAVVMRRRMRRETLTGLAEKLPACVVGMEACCGSHHLGRVSTAARKCARWRRESVPVGLREKGREALVCFSFAASAEACAASGARLGAGGGDLDFVAGASIVGRFLDGAGRRTGSALSLFAGGEAVTVAVHLEDADVVGHASNKAPVSRSDPKTSRSIRRRASCW